MIVSDEYGASWVVENGDPLSDAFRALVRSGFREETIVAPQALLLGGQLVWPLEPPNKPWEGEEFLRWCRLNDTCAALQNVLG